MDTRKGLILAAAISFAGAGSGSAFAQAAVPTNALDHIYRSIDELQQEAWTDKRPTQYLACDPYYGCGWVSAAPPPAPPYGRPRPRY